jgi:hypothetical protein
MGSWQFAPSSIPRVGHDSFRECTTSGADFRIWVFVRVLVLFKSTPCGVYALSVPFVDFCSEFCSAGFRSLRLLVLVPFRPEGRTNLRINLQINLTIPGTASIEHEGVDLQLTGLSDLAPVDLARQLEPEAIVALIMDKMAFADFAHTRVTVDMAFHDGLCIAKSDDCGRNLRDRSSLDASKPSRGRVCGTVTTGRCRQRQGHFREHSH